jgi:DNA-binding transcriptional LysR family regulator
MRLESLTELRVFVQVADSGGFTRAARTLGSTTNTVSRLIASLEARLQVLLLTRTTRRVVLTEDGRAFYAQAIRVLQAAEAAEQILHSEASPLEGTVRIAARSTTVQFGFVKDLSALLSQNPALRAQLIVSDAELDLAAEGIDVAVRVGALADSSYRSVLLGTVAFVLAASPTYLAAHALPATPEALIEHECIRVLQHRPQATWRLEGPGGRIVDAPVSGRFECADLRAQAEALYSGFGIGLRPEGEVRAAVANGELVRVLPHWRMVPLPVYALLSPQRIRNPKVEAVLALLKELVARLG